MAALGIIYCASTIDTRFGEARRALWCSTAAVTPGLAGGLECVLRLALNVSLDASPFLRGLLLTSCVWYVAGPMLFFFAWFDAPLRQAPALTAVRALHGVHWLLTSLVVFIAGVHTT